MRNVDVPDGSQTSITTCPLFLRGGKTRRGQWKDSAFNRLSISAGLWVDGSVIFSGGTIACTSWVVAREPPSSNSSSTGWRLAPSFCICRCPTSPSLSRRPARGLYSRLTHKRRASYGYALGLSDWRLVSGFDCVGTPE